MTTLAEVIANTDPRRTVNVEQATGGYIVTGQTVYVDRDTKGVVANASDRGVYVDATTAAAAIAAYLSNGTLG